MVISTSQTYDTNTLCMYCMLYSGCNTILNILSHPVHGRSDSPSNSPRGTDDNGSDSGSSLLTSIRHHLVRKGGLSLLLHQLVSAASSQLPIDSSTAIRGRGHSRSNSLSSQVSAMSAATTSITVRPMPGLARVGAGLLRCLLASAHPRVSVIGKMGHRVSQLVMDLTRKMWRRRSQYQLTLEEKLRNERNKQTDNEVVLGVPPVKEEITERSSGPSKSTRDSIISPGSPVPQSPPPSSPSPPDLGVHARLRFTPRFTVAYSLPILCDLAEVSSLLCRQSSSHRERLGRIRSDEERRLAIGDDDDEDTRKRINNEVESGLESLLETVRLLLFVASTPPATTSSKKQRHTSLSSPSARVLAFNGMPSPLSSSAARARSSSRDSRTSGSTALSSSSPTGASNDHISKKWRRRRDKFEWSRNGDWEQNCVRASLRALAMASLNSRDNQRSIIERGGVELTTLCMRGWQAVASVQSDACELLWKLCMCGDLRDKLPVAAIDDKKAVANADIESERRRIAIADATRTAMKAHATLPLLQARACGVIWALVVARRESAISTDNNNMSSNDDNNRAIARLNLGVADVLAAMAAHPIASLVQEQGCLALSALCEDNAEQQAAITKAGGIAIVVDGMVAHIATPSVLLHACILLSTLLASSLIKPQSGGAPAGQPGSVTATIVDHDGIAAVISAMRESASTPSPVATLLHHHAIDVLHHLSCISQYRIRIVNEGALSSLLRIIRAPHPPDVHIKACAELALLATESANRATIVRKGSVEILLAVIARPDINVAAEAAYALACLMISDIDDDKDDNDSKDVINTDSKRTDNDGGSDSDDENKSRQRASVDIESKRIAARRVVLNKGGLDLLISTIIANANVAPLVARFLSALAAFTAPPLSLAAPHLLAHPSHTNGTTSPTSSNATNNSNNNAPLPALYQEIINRFITHKRGLDCLVAALKTHTNDAHVVEAASSLLANITHPCALLYYRHSVHQSPQSSATAAAAAVVAAATAAANSNSNAAAVATAASTAPPATSFLWNSLFARNGGAEVILRAMQRHPTSSGVQEQSMRALSHLLCQLGNWAAFYGHAMAMQLATAQASSITSSSTSSSTSGKMMSLVPPPLPASTPPSIPINSPPSSPQPGSTPSIASTAAAAAATALNQQRDLELRGWSALLRGGVIEAILSGMRSHHSMIGVASRGCRALTILCRWLPSHLTLPPPSSVTTPTTAAATVTSSPSTPPSLRTNAPPPLPTNGPPTGGAARFGVSVLPPPSSATTAPAKGLELSLDAFLSTSTSSSSDAVSPSPIVPNAAAATSVPQSSQSSSSSMNTTGGMSPLLALVNQGCIETIITVMYSHIFNRSLQVDSLTAFMAIFAAGVSQSSSSSSNSDDIERHKSWLAGKTQMCAEAVLTSCQGAVMKMEAVLKEDRSRRRSEGGGAAFGITDNVDDHHPADILTNPYQYVVDIQSRACQVLHILASLQSSTRSLLADRLGAIPIVLEAISSLCNVPQVLHPAAGVITQLCDTVDHRKIVADKKGIEVLLISLRRLTSYRSRSIAAGASSPMTPVNNSSPSSSTTTSSGGVSRSAARAEESLLSALTASCVDCTDACDAFSRHGGVDICLDLLRMASSVSLQRHVMGLLRAACTRSTVGESMVNKRGLQLVIGISSLSPSNSIVSFLLFNQCVCEY
jgi:hypothetical protein